ncbi:hypothetical protein N657DRAFT_343510 [Parathielavia appendiculata]|uniref:Extracellular membrane protein CFEM domain-containing protein n=1 Tax=Parathielavia appendiculata TaxID=2587402 RepID=A0AAN6U224_9PEZI|nr:hypothetical protein N657DRAFT_343510 [Parathielavia appendiculata]
MKNAVIPSLLSLAGLVHAQWWAGAPECADDCFSSWWNSATEWPAPTNYCSATQGASVSSCLQSACSATPTAIASYSSLSSSLCSKWSSCSSAGSTGVYTVSAPAFTGDWRGLGGRWRGDDNHDDSNNDDDTDGGWDWDGDGNDDGNEWNQFTRTWTGGVYTVTGCEWNGNVWAGGPFGYGQGGVGGSPWGPWGKGWTWSTATQTVTRVVTITSDGGATALSTSVGLATVAQAVSGHSTTRSIIGEATGGGGSGGAAATGGVQQGDAGRNEALGLKVMGALLGGVLALAAWL